MNKYRRSWQENLVFAADIIIICFCYIAAYFIRFDGSPPLEYLKMMGKMLPVVFIGRMSALIYFKLHKSIWKYASIKDLAQIIKAVTISSVLIVAGVMFLQRGHPRSIFIIDWLLLVIGLSGTRFIIRLSRPLRWRKSPRGRRKKILIVGAGDTGEMILREMIYHYRLNYEVVGLIDDSPKKYRKHIHGIAVLGTRSEIPDIVRKKGVEEIIIAIPSLTSAQMHDLVNYCIKSGAKYRTVPNISDLIDGVVKVKELREIKLEDLLKRGEIFLDRQKVGSYIKGKSILITGAGGSIGSELCIEVARLAPKELVLFEESENALFYIDMELGQFFKELRKFAIVGNICDRIRVREVFFEYKPQIIFHAAAHKHVPLMEANFAEAVKNNVFGTKVLVEEAANFGVERFIMLSTDKAVDPISIMGVSKRIAERYVTAFAKRAGKKFIAVRFGNVLGSEGSVIPIFRKQIEIGGPLTVTHSQIKRYFMTIPEAAVLVLEAGLMGKGGEIFTLEMGKQIKIADLAQNLIKLSGKENVEIVFTGLRPGEKMEEVLSGVNEKLIKTNHEKIFVAEPQKEDEGDIFEEVKALEKIVEQGNRKAFLEKLKEIVPTYCQGSAKDEAKIVESK